MSNAEISVEQQMDVTREVMKALSLMDNEVVVAGGSCRNWEEGKLANDIDTYIRGNSGTLAATKLAIETLLDGDITPVSCKDHGSYNWGGPSLRITRLYSFWYKGVLFQLIMVKVGMESEDFASTVMDHFDVGLNKIYYQYSRDWGAVNFVRTSEYRHDKDSKSMTIDLRLLGDGQLKHCVSTHLPKMLRYYPDHQLMLTGGLHVTLDMLKGLSEIESGPNREAFIEILYKIEVKEYE